MRLQSDANFVMTLGWRSMAVTNSASALTDVWDALNCQWVLKASHHSEHKPAAHDGIEISFGNIGNGENAIGFKSLPPSALNHARAQAVWLSPRNTLG